MLLFTVFALTVIFDLVVAIAVGVGIKVLMVMVEKVIHRVPQAA